MLGRFLVLILCLSGPIFADTVILKNGQVIIGQITAQTRTDVQILTNGQTITLQKEAIRRIQFGDNKAEIEKQEADRRRAEEAQRAEAERRAREQADAQKRQDQAAREARDAKDQKDRAEKEAREAPLRRRYFSLEAGGIDGFYQSAVLEMYSQHQAVIVQRGGFNPGVIRPSASHDRGLRGGDGDLSFTWNRFYVEAGFLSFFSKQNAVLELMPTSGSGYSASRNDLDVSIRRNEAHGGAGDSVYRTQDLDVRALALYRDELMWAQIQSYGPGFSSDPNRPAYIALSYDDGIRYRVQGMGGGISVSYKIKKFQLFAGASFYRMRGPWGLTYQDMERSGYFTREFVPLFLSTEGVMRKKTTVLEPGAAYDLPGGMSLKLSARFEQSAYSLENMRIYSACLQSGVPDAPNVFILSKFAYNGFAFKDKLNQHDSVQFVKLSVEKRFDF